MKLLAVFGTRPEAIKMAPVLRALAGEPVTLSLCLTGQHRELLDQALGLFDISPDIDLGLMDAGQSLNGFVARAVDAIDRVFADLRPDRILVHGDTASAMAAALAAFHRSIPVAHVEAGLRSRRLDRPFPEEMNRRVVDLASDMLFAPTPQARANLEAEALAGRIFVTGNTGIDALLGVADRLEGDADLRARADAALPKLDEAKKLLLVTAHRRESFGSGLIRICNALTRLARRGDVEIVFPVHPNPAVRGPVEEALAGHAGVHLVPPLDYLPFVRLMQRSAAILTDSGGIQEEAPSLGKPVVVMRDVTERPEAVAAGAARLVGTDADQIAEAAEELLEASPRSAIANPYGDGRAASRITAALLERPFEEFVAPAG